MVYVVMRISCKRRVVVHEKEGPGLKPALNPKNKNKNKGKSKGKSKSKTENKTRDKSKNETKNQERSLTLKGGFGMTSKSKSKSKGKSKGKGKGKGKGKTTPSADRSLLRATSEPHEWAAEPRLKPVFRLLPFPLD